MIRRAASPAASQGDLRQAQGLRDPDLQTRVAALSAAWRRMLAPAPVTQALDRLGAMLANRLAAGAIIYPTEPFRALSGLAPQDIRVVILGQDPYHGPGQAQGLAFSVPRGIPRPPSLRNILGEIDREYPGNALTTDSDLSGWIEQGVLLLNTVLTVEDGKPGAHARMGWETVTDALIAGVAALPQPVVFMLWGAHAQAKHALIADAPNHLVLTANHPSPLSARRGPKPFVGCGHFRVANTWLTQQNCPEILWKQ
jgi:uracil-DNA glycosylase